MEAPYKRFPPEATGAIRWVVKSPPYYGMNTYVPDQWLLLWFLVGLPELVYRAGGQIRHSSPEEFAVQIPQVWMQAGDVCAPGRNWCSAATGRAKEEMDKWTCLRGEKDDGPPPWPIGHCRPIHCPSEAPGSDRMKIGHRDPDEGRHCVCFVTLYNYRQKAQSTNKLFSATCWKRIVLCCVVS